MFLIPNHFKTSLVEHNMSQTYGYSRSELKQEVEVKFLHFISCYMLKSIFFVFNTICFVTDLP